MIPLIDLQSQFKTIQQNIETAVLNVLRSGQYIQGPEVLLLEQSLANYVGVKHAISCASGTDALLMALMAKNIGPGDAIFTTPFTFVATAEVIALLGATPVFVDIDPVTYNIDCNSLEKAIQALNNSHEFDYPLPKDAQTKSLRPRGIIPVDLFGLAADYDQINAIAVQYGLFVIEDAAQSFGAKYKNKNAGALAEIGCTSFFPAKPLGGYGDGGAIFTDDDSLAEQLRSIRAHGQGQDRYENVRLGITGRLDTIQAAILIEKLKIFPAEIDSRQRVANSYSARISTAGLSFVTPSIPDNFLSAWAQYSLLAKNEEHRQITLEKLRNANISSAVYYPRPLHLQKAFENLGYRHGHFPVSENCASRIFSLPMHPYINDETIQIIIDAMR